MKELAVFFGEALGRYAFADSHPLGAGRLPAFWREVTRRGLMECAAVEAPELCGEKD